jgi:chromosome segregation ATPase
VAGLKSITPPPDFGDSLSLEAYEARITAFSGTVDEYNEKLSALDQLLNELETAEAALREENRRFLSAAQAHYGSDSSEYEQVGGTRRSDRKRPGPKGPRTPLPPRA